MLLSLNGATTMKADLETDIRAASRAGFDLIEIWGPKLREYLRQHTVQELKVALRDQKIRACSINSIEHITFRTSDRHFSLLSECEELCHIASEIDCESVVVVPSPKPEGISEAEVIAESVLVLHELSDVAARYGVKLAFEFLGFPDCSVRTLDLCRRIVERTNCQNVGLVVDTFHFYVGESSLESISQLNPDQIFVFHINDAENRPKTELRDSHRLLPGLGILPLADILSALRGIGYDKMASVEIFRPEYWDMNPMELAVKAKAAAEDALGLVSRSAAGD